MVDSRAKGSRGEYLVRDMLRGASGLKFERVPSSGALAYLKGDLYVPDEKNLFCIEVKNYETSPISDKMLINKSNLVVCWWNKINAQAALKEQKPLLFIKYNRAPVFVVTRQMPEETDMYMFLPWLDCFILEAKEWLDKEEIKWVQ